MITSQLRNGQLPIELQPLTAYTQKRAFYQLSWRFRLSLLSYCFQYFNIFVFFLGQLECCFFIFFFIPILKLVHYIYSSPNMSAPTNFSIYISKLIFVFNHSEFVFRNVYSGLLADIFLRESPGSFPLLYGFNTLQYELEHILSITSQYMPTIC